jgi:hypothetical protein
VVDLEVLHAECPVTLLAVLLALHLAVLIGTLPVNIAPDNHNVSHTVITQFPVARSDKLASAAELASRGVPPLKLRTCSEDGAHNLLP